MILSALLGILAGIIGLAFSALRFVPGAESEFPSQVSSAVIFFSGYIYQWNWILPVSDAVEIFRYSIMLSLGIMAYKSIKWGLGMIRGTGVGV